MAGIDSLKPGELRSFNTGVHGYRIVVVAGQDQLHTHFTIPEDVVDEYAYNAAGKTRFYADALGIDSVDLAASFYADTIAEKPVPRGVFVLPKEADDPEVINAQNIATLTKIIRTPWAQTLNNRYDLSTIFADLRSPFFDQDMYGFLRGTALHALVDELAGRPSFVYFDRMRRFPGYARASMQVLQRFELAHLLEDQDEQSIGGILRARFDDAAAVTGGRFDHNPAWQAYARKWGQWHPGERL